MSETREVVDKIESLADGRFREHVIVYDGTEVCGRFTRIDPPKETMECCGGPKHGEMLTVRPRIGQQGPMDNDNPCITAVYRYEAREVNGKEVWWYTGRTK